MVNKHQLKLSGCRSSHVHAASPVEHFSVFPLPTLPTGPHSDVFPAVAIEVSDHGDRTAEVGSRSNVGSAAVQGVDLDVRGGTSGSPCRIGADKRETRPDAVYLDPRVKEEIK